MHLKSLIWIHTRYLANVLAILIISMILNMHFAITEIILLWS